LAHVIPPAQTFPHLPQLFESLAVSTQVVTPFAVQLVFGALHVQTLSH
jgi:hypothetical protein